MFCYSHKLDFSNKHLSSAWSGNHKQAWQTAAIWLKSQHYSIRADLFFGGHLELYFIYLVLLNLIFICSCKLPEWPWTWKGNTFFPPNKETDDLIGKWDTYGIVFTSEQVHLRIKPLDFPSFFPPLFYYGETSVSEEDVPSSPHAIPHSPAVGVAASLPWRCLSARC